MDPNDELTMHPGPKIPSVLHLQSSHRSSTVWDVCGGDAHRSRRRNPTQARFPPLHESMIPILEDLRFDGHITHWNHRQEHLIGVIAHSGVGVVDGYYEWYTNITRRFHTRIAGSHFYTLDMFDHISSIARGEIDGSIEDIAHLCAHARQLVKNAFNYGVFQDYPVKDRREKEILKRPKPKKAGHKGGRGGVNAPKQQGIQIDDIPRGDNVGADIIDKDVENLQGGETVPGGVHLEHPEVLTEVNPTPPFGLPNWNLLPSGDFLRMSNDAVLYHSPDRSIPHDPAPNDHSPISHPTFNLMSQSPPRPQLVQQKQVSPPAALSMVTPTPTFTAGRIIKIAAITKYEDVDVKLDRPVEEIIIEQGTEVVEK
uniref:Aminotransferase-like plant mobile domain-containing protein n=1 Tax=Daucus carota subsp. sativus TaxID=79200 RepID=A0A166GXD8_DAUCS